jgi:hypothetical protein
MRSIGFVVVLILTVVPEAALAQEKGQVGLTMGYPTSVGILWHVADRVALRPDLTFNQSEVTGTLTLTVGIGNQIQTTQTQFSTTSTSVTTGLSGLFYVRKRDALSVFLSPRYTYSHGSTTPSATPPATASGGTTTRTHGVSGSFGAQYAIGRRFSIFGEVGVAYSTSVGNSPDAVTPSTTSRSENAGHGVGMRSGVGVVLYFH